MDLKHRPTIKFTGIILATLLVASFFLVIISNSIIRSEFKEQLKIHTDNLVAIYLSNNQIDDAFLKKNGKIHLEISSNQDLFIYTDSAFAVFTEMDLPEYLRMYFVESLRHKNEVFYYQSDTLLLAYNFHLKKNTLKIITSTIDNNKNTAFYYLLFSIFLFIIVGVTIAIILSQHYSKLAKSPMNELMKQVEKVTESSLNERLNVGDGKDGFALLALTFNKMLDRLESAFKLQKTFVSNASHEFRTPLTVMKGQIEVLLLQPRNVEVYIKTFQSLLDDINNQIDLINGLGNLASADANFPNMVATKVSIIELLDECVSELYRNKRYSVFLNIEDLHEDENAMYIMCNHALLKSALMNVMDNACKFNEQPSCEVNVSCNLDYIVITVVDKGLGISNDDLANIFESFYRANNTRHIQGHGIGLSLVKKIIEYYKGKIVASSELGKGTRMNIFLPNLNTKGVNKF